MKRLFANILLVALVVGSASFLADFLLKEGLRRSEKNKFGKMNDIVFGRVNADIVISGSSRAIYHFDPRIITAETGMSAYNIGLSGAQAKLQLYALKTYLLHNSTPKIIVQGLDIISLYDKKDVFNPELFIPYLHESELFNGLTSLDKAYFLYRYVPMYSFAVHQDLKLLAIKAWLGKEGRQTLSGGYQAQDKVWTDDFEKFKEQHPGGLVQENDKSLLWIFQEIVDICKAKGIKLVFVYPPEYIEVQKFTKNRGEILGLLREFAARNGIAFIDYSDSGLCSDKNLFYNTQHLNRHGAEVFTRDFAARLKLLP